MNIVPNRTSKLEDTVTSHILVLENNGKKNWPEGSLLKNLEGFLDHCFCIKVPPIAPGEKFQCIFITDNVATPKSLAYYDYEINTWKDLALPFHLYT